MIQVKDIDGLLLREMFIAGAALLEKNREAVDALNVFPVPDGDTGTNMSLTMASAVREVNQKESNDAGSVAKAMAKGALRGARGNSGVITSQIYRGFAKALDGVEKITPVQFANAMKCGADTAYKAVMKPKEGTILTVARVMADDAVRQAQAAPEDFDALFETILKSGDAILKRTPEMLPVLKQAGVVDAGGRGLLLIYMGYAAVLRGETIDTTPAESANAETEAAGETEALEEIKFAYCDNFMVQGLRDDLTEEEFETFRRKLNRIGERVTLDRNENTVKVQVYTNNPAKPLQYGLEMGELVDIKIENLVEQRRRTLREKEETAVKEPPKPYGMVSVSLGSGFASIFKDLQVDAVVDGGQTMNPSIEDLQKAIDNVNAETVFVFPNNGNVILAAQQAAQICEHQVKVVPTKNVAMGIAAAVAFNPEMNADDNAAAMEEASQRVRTGMITYAVRDSDYEDLHIQEGDIIGLHNGAVEHKSNSIYEVAMALAKDIVTEDDVLISLYYGADTAREDAEALGQELEKMFPDCDVDVHMGGQPLYYYIIAVE